MENYTKFSQNLNNTEEVKEEEIILTDLADANIIDGSTVEMIEEPVEEVEEPVEEVETVIGVVSGCERLNLRKESSKDSNILVVLNKGVELVVSPEESTEDFYKVVTEAGVEGYCMKKFITIK